MLAITPNSPYFDSEMENKPITQNNIIIFTILVNGRMESWTKSRQKNISEHIAFVPNKRTIKLILHLLCIVNNQLTSINGNINCLFYLSFFCLGGKLFPITPAKMKNENTNLLQFFHMNRTGFQPTTTPTKTTTFILYTHCAKPIRICGEHLCHTARPPPSAMCNIKTC